MGEKDTQIYFFFTFCFCINFSGHDHDLSHAVMKRGCYYRHIIMNCPVLGSWMWVCYRWNLNNGHLRDVSVIQNIKLMLADKFPQITCRRYKVYTTTLLSSVFQVHSITD